MNRPRQAWWWLYAACAFAALAALLWVSVVVLELEASERAARTESQQQEALRLGLWRMDAWMSAQLAREGARPYFEYLAYYPQQTAYTRIFSEIDPGEVLTPSPLLTFQSDFFRLHFQITEKGHTSPQCPLGNQRDIAEVICDPVPEFNANMQLLDELRPLLRLEEVRAKVASAEARMAERMGEETLDYPSQQELLLNAQQAEAQDRAQQDLNRSEWINRAQNVYQAPQKIGKLKTGKQQTHDGGEDADFQEPLGAAAAPAETRVDTSETEEVIVGTLVPIWLAPEDDPGARRLCFVRRVKVNGGEIYQGFLAEVGAIRDTLMSRLQSFLPGASLEAVPEEEMNAAEETGLMLATVPFRLEAPPVRQAAAPLLTPARGTLALTWIAVLLTVAAAAVTLRASIAFGEKRSRFASAVTHELRTPLTTFRMYSEMLADGMVTDEDKRKRYLETLRSESERLSRLVENVLAYSRLEEGRAATRATATTAGKLLDQVRPALEDRAREAGLELSVEAGGAGGVQLSTDLDAVGQILFNLVDNACKYAAGSVPPVVHLSAAGGDQELQLRVWDHGAGVPAAHARAVFAPFDRGAVQAGDTIPGVGLGLALSRQLARELKGDLVLEAAPDCGACFVLTLPAST